MSDFNFKVGDKITLTNWENREWFQIKCIDGDDLFGREQTRCAEIHKINRCWLPYSEPKPEFDWNGEGFWGNEDDEKTCWYAKVTHWTWHIMDQEMQFVGTVSRNRIEKHVTRCPPPPWAHLIEEAKEIKND